MSGLDRVGLIGRGKRRVEKVWIASGVYACVRSWVEREHTAYEAKLRADKSAGMTPDFRRRILVISLCDDDGNRLFQDSEEELLGDLNAADAALLFDKAWSIAGFNAREVSELEKNFDAGIAAGSPSESDSQSGDSTSTPCSAS